MYYPEGMKARVSPVQSIEPHRILSFHQYADDTQLYIGTNSSMLTTQIASIESCTQKVHNWLLNNGLHLNPSKSEAIVFYNPRSKPLAALAESIGTVSVAGSLIKLQHQLGIWVFTLTQKCPLISRCPKHARLVISIFAPSVTFVLLLLLRLLKP